MQYSHPLNEFKLSTDQKQCHNDQLQRQSHSSASPKHSQRAGHAIATLKRCVPHLTLKRQIEFPETLQLI